MSDIKKQGYYIIDGSSNDFFDCFTQFPMDDCYDTLDEAIFAAREKIYTLSPYYSACVYIQPSESDGDGNYHLMTAEYVFSVNGGEDDTGCYTINEYIEV